MAKKEVRGFQYQKRTKDDLKERANMKGGNFDNYIKPKFKVWKPKDGKNIIRILPPTWAGARHYGLDIFVNYNIGSDNQAYLSLSKHTKGADPIAEAKQEAMREGEKDFAKKLNPTQRLLYWIIDRNDEDEGPLLWASPFTFDKSLANICIDEDTKEVMYIDDPEEGNDVRFYREGTGLNTTYDASKMKTLAASPIHEDEGLQNEWLDFITANPLPDVLNFYEYDHIKAAFNGQVGGRDDDEEEKPKRRAKVEDEEKPRVRRAVVEAETDEEEVVPPRRSRITRPDPDVEDEPPAPKARARARPAPEPVDDEEDDESPPTKSRRGSEEGGGSLRERLAARRRSPDPDEDE